jgi:hypothetical protein
MNVRSSGLLKKSKKIPGCGFGAGFTGMLVLSGLGDPDGLD